MSEWGKKYLPELAKFINGYAFKPSDWQKEGLPIIRIEQLKDNNAKFDYFSGKVPEYNIIENGDLIFSWSASLFLQIWQRGKAILNQHLFKVENFNNTERLFLKYIIEYNLEELLKSAHGSTMQHITRKELNKFKVYIPTSKQEQQKIAKILSTIDRSIEQTEKLIAKYRRIKTGMMQDLLTKGIDDKGNIRNEKTHKFKDSPLGRVPVEWEVVKLGELKPFITSGSRNWAQYYASEGALFIRIGNLTREHINMRFDDIQRVNATNTSEGNRTKLKKNDLLISITADLGIIAVIPENFEEAYINQHIALVRFNSENIYPRFIGNFLSSRIGSNQFLWLNDSGAKAGLSLKTVEKILIAIPTLTEQIKIENRFKAVEKSIAIERNKLFKLQKLKTGLMQDLLSGKVRVGYEKRNK